MLEFIAFWAPLERYSSVFDFDDVLNNGRKSGVIRRVFVSGSGEQYHSCLWYVTQPDLARFALDMLAIPAMSAECERVFSSAKHLITDARNRLNPDIIEANECLKHWFGKPAEEKGSKEENGPKGKTGLKEGEDSKFEEAEASEKEVLLRIKKGYESDVVMYEVDSDDEIVWRD